MTVYWVIDWSKIQTIDDIKTLLQCCDIQPKPEHPMFYEIKNLCKAIDDDGNAVEEKDNVGWPPQTDEAGKPMTYWGGLNEQSAKLEFIQGGSCLFRVMNDGRILNNKDEDISDDAEQLRQCLIQLANWAVR